MRAISRTSLSTICTPSVRGAAGEDRRADEGRTGGDARGARAARRRLPKRGSRPRSASGSSRFSRSSSSAAVESTSPVLRLPRLPHHHHEPARQLRGARRGPPALAADPGAVQGLHRDAEAEPLPVAPHDAARQARPAVRGPDPDPERWIWWPRRGSPPTGATRREAHRAAERSGTSSGSASCSTGRGSVTDSRSFLSALKIDLYPDEVYVLSPKGDVLAFPGAPPRSTSLTGSTPISGTGAPAPVNGRPCRCAPSCATATSSRSSRAPPAIRAATGSTSSSPRAPRARSGSGSTPSRPSRRPSSAGGCWKRSCGGTRRARRRSTRARR